MKHELLEELNESQRKAVQHTDGPLLIVAGAGTGKTTVITKRLAWLIQEGLAKPDELLALTFTEKAAEEMEERIDRLLPMGYVDLWTLTFHAFGEKILREHAIEIGLDPGFKVLSQSEQWLFIRQHLYEFELDYYRPLGNPTRFIYALVSHFSRAKDENITPDEYLKYASKLEKENKKKIKEASDEDLKQALKEEIDKAFELAKAYEAYQRLMREAGQMDFGDLIMYTLQLFQTRKSLLTKYRDQFKFILVDEFQDTNFAQYELVKLLAAPKNNLTVCGDDDQSIYKFRGAAVSNILGYKKDFPDSGEAVLTENYRSTQPILDVAYASIQLNNPDRLEAQMKIEKKLRATNEGKTKPEILFYETDHDESHGVVEKIIELEGGSEELSWKDFAILVRSNSQADAFLQQLDRKSIPYQFVASKGLYSSPEIMDLVAYLRILHNPYDNASAFRVLASPHFSFDMLDVVKLQSQARRRNVTLLDMLQEIDSVTGVEEDSRKAAKKLLDLLDGHTKLAKTKTAGQILYQFIGDTQYIRTLLQEKDVESTKKVLNISEFFKQMKDFESGSADPSLKNFIEELDMLQEAGEDPAPANPEEGPDMVNVMTVHQAKGLEFEHVFVVNLVDQRFPTRMRGEAIPLPQDLIRESVPEKEAHVQEERRLFYVALTRAKNGLYLTAAKDYGGKRKKKPSVFLNEIENLLSAQSQKASDLLTAEKEEEVESQDFELSLPPKFSFTQLAAFENCPRQYQYAHIFKIQPPGRHTFSYGQSLHKALELFYKLLQQGEEPIKEKLLELFEKAWISDWYDSKAHEAKQKKKGEETLSAYFESNKDSMKAPLFIEKDFNLKIEGATFQGKIDRIDKVKDGVEIVDYKTGRVKTQKEVDKDEQLSLYALACQEVLDLTPKKLSLYFLDEGVKVETERSEEQLIAFKEKVVMTLGHMRESDFSPTPGFACQFCDFLNICEAGMKQVGK